MSAFSVLAKPQSEVLADMGTALLLVKNARALTLSDMAIALGRTDDMIAKYIAGESEMGALVWMRALETWPELSERLHETSAERALRARQRALDLNLTRQRPAAA